MHIFRCHDQWDTTAGYTCHSDRETNSNDVVRLPFEILIFRWWHPCHLALRCAFQLNALARKCCNRKCPIRFLLIVGFRRPLLMRSQGWQNQLLKMSFPSRHPSATNLWSTLGQSFVSIQETSSIDCWLAWTLNAQTIVPTNSTPAIFFQCWLNGTILVEKLMRAYLTCVIAWAMPKWMVTKLRIACRFCIKRWLNGSTISSHKILLLFIWHKHKFQ